MSLRNPCLRRALYGAASVIGSGTLLGVGLFCLVALGTMTGCSVNVVVAPNATLGLHSDLSQNAVQELERGRE